MLCVTKETVVRLTVQLPQHYKSTDMKKMILLLVLASLTAIFVPDVFGLKGSARQTSKAVNFEIFAGTDYRYKIYDESIASVQLNVYRACKGKKELVWTKTMDAIQLSKLPTLHDAIIVTANVNGVCQGMDQLEASYKIFYNAKGNVLETSSYAIIVKDVKNDRIAVTV